MKKEKPAKLPPPPEPEPEPELEPEGDEPVSAPVEPPESDDDSSDPALFLPSSTDEIVVEPSAKRPGAAASDKPAAAKAAPSPRAPEAPAEKNAKNRQSAVYLAAMAGGALGLLSVVAIFMMLRSEPQPVSRPTGASPFGKRASGDASLTPVIDDEASGTPAAFQAESPMSPPPVLQNDEAPPTSLPAPALSRPVAPPSPVAATPPPAAKAVAPAPVAAPVSPPAVEAPPSSRPTATFAPIARPKVVGVPAPKAEPAAVAKPAVKKAAPKKAAGPQWVFEGSVYDLLSTHGVFGVRLVFVDAEENEIASCETNADGRYRATMSAGPAEGYGLHIIHDDYSGKHIDELDSTSSVRKADLEQRKFLMQAGARSLPWIGMAGKTVRRDMALVPKVQE